jgi:hypothetical protein
MFGMASDYIYEQRDIDKGLYDDAHGGTSEWRQSTSNWDSGLGAVVGLLGTVAVVGGLGYVLYLSFTGQLPPM